MVLMKINLNPQFRDEANTLSVAVSADIIVINGEIFDFSPLTEGSTLPRAAITSEWITGDITRKDGQIELTLLLPLTLDASPAACFPEPIIVTTNGPVELPT
ncbi:hypothetical protein D3C75_950240 [compost metagenome]